MKWLIPGFVIGVASGVVATWMWQDSPAPPVASVAHTAIVRDIREIPRMSEQDAASHRAERFASMTTIEQMLALPSDFDQTEALLKQLGKM